MKVKFTLDRVRISQNKGTSKMFGKDVILAVCDIINHFHEFWQLFLEFGAYKTQGILEKSTTFQPKGEIRP